ncbi:MAG: DegT/DnrJ/EryC1/StrS family aminotransferase [Nanoarchaeota archaeon]
MEKPVILGGKPVLTSPLPRTNNIDEKEKSAAMRVLDSGVLSDFIGNAGDKFLGGKEVLQLEEYFKERFKVKHAVTFNSATTALEAAICALGIGPGDEVIVSPYTMSATATSILMNMATPVFADIETDTFNLDPKSIIKNITSKTKAIFVVNLFGGSARYDEILKIAKENNIKIIEDNAQGMGGKYGEKHLGAIGDIGVFSFNCHKTIQCGEGGVLVTNNQRYAYRAQLKRNHGEVVADALRIDEAVLGSNYRLTELQAAIAVEQLKKLDFLNEKRIRLANYLTEKLREIPGFTPPFVLPDTKHVYYLYPIKFDEQKVGISRSLFAKAMEKEGFLLNQGYVKPIYLMKIFQEKKIFPHSHFPFENENYSEGICPNTEWLYHKELLYTNICRHPLTTEHIDLFVMAIKKVIAHASELNAFERASRT